MNLQVEFKSNDMSIPVEFRQVQIIPGTGQGGATENLDAELQTQDNIIAQIASALEGKAAGSAKTATVTIENPDNPALDVIYCDGTQYKKLLIDSGEVKTIRPSINSCLFITDADGIHVYSWYAETSGDLLDACQEYNIYTATTCIYSVSGDGTIQIIQDGGLEL